MKEQPEKRTAIPIGEVFKEKVGSRSVKIDVEGMREVTARNLSIIMIVIFIALIIIPIIPFFHSPAVISYLKDILPIVTVLLGASFGFYFSEKRLGS